MAHGEDGHHRCILDLEQRHVAALAEGDEQLAQERVVAGLAVDERGVSEALHRTHDGTQCLLGKIKVLDRGGPIEQVVV